MYIKKNIVGVRITVIFFFLNVFMVGCSSKDSGLYQLNAQEELIQDELSVMQDYPDDAIQENDDEDKKMAVASEDICIFVHVCGAVKNPGVYEFTKGDRVFNAIEAAGGFSEDAADDFANLASELEDGMKITIPTVEEVEALQAEGATEVFDYDKTGDINSSTAAKEDCVNINTADVTLLTTLPGIGETRAAAIVAYREAHGKFSNIEDITKVSGIGTSTFEKFKDKITVN